MNQERFQQLIEANDGMLDISGCSLEQIPDELQYLQGLRAINLADNCLLSLDGIEVQLSLQHITAWNNQLREIPHGISKCCNLESLFIDCNFIEYIPRSIGDLSKLHLLSMRHNRVRSLPLEIAMMSELHRFDCSRNSIADIPQSMQKLHRLREINLSFNQLEHFPESLLHCPNIWAIVLRSNQITKLPSSLFSFKKPIELHLNHNPIEASDLERLVLPTGSVLFVDRKQYGMLGTRQLETFDIQIDDDAKP